MSRGEFRDEVDEKEEPMVYDPEMDPAETRQIRKQYREVLATQAESRANINAVHVPDLMHDLSQLDSMFGGVKRAQEATLDSKAVMNLSEMTAMKARAMKHSVGGFDVEDFISKLVNFMGIQPAGGNENHDGDNEDDGEVMLNWDKIGYLALAKSRRATGASFMMGPISAEQKKRTTKRAFNKIDRDPSKQVTTQDVDPAEVKKNENETAANVEKIGNLLEQSGSVNYFKFIINPHSFEQSVENLFYFSFLIRDGKAAWDISENKEPIVYRCDPPTQKDYDENLQRRQSVLEFDMDTWKRAIEVFNIREPMIPTRPAVPDKEKYPSFKVKRQEEEEAAASQENLEMDEGEDE
ncbi:Nse4 C-terminal-domain-containing protein [Cantharellus anzutake]|uniref:Nse4 C-terminal-domain-containing protein n=1 Tax=Cantharellus anzutake TaxID=1750568 RepID=UPI001904DE27|nr:Nse4 C-terminal-domain-containing protein [Cantharellus anzutake]KAF8342145.1 Nse4 C-terminal-domain-containing protein [Cantharellus anzutake]